MQPWKWVIVVVIALRMCDAPSAVEILKDSSRSHGQDRNRIGTRSSEATGTSAVEAFHLQRFYGGVMQS